MNYSNIGKLTFFILMVASLFSFGFPNSNAKITEKIPDHYIIVLKDDVENVNLLAEELTAKHNIKSNKVYEHALKGFSAKIPPSKLQKIINDPRIEFIEPDYTVHIFTTESQIISTGINRTDVILNEIAKIDGIDERIDIDIAILDTGIDLNHPDLNVVDGKSFVQKDKNPNDNNGHGTHVAGIAAAIDNGFGVVGVAPGARLYAVKVLDNTGFGKISDVLAGVNWVTKNSDVIDVANLSLGCFCNSNSLHKAIQKSVDEGVVFTVAAGNQGIDASFVEPASYSEVITVSAIADSDGKCGSLGPTTEFGNDDTLALFSNFGESIDIAAPGVAILSTSYNGGYAIKSGTSMASPHVAGGIALFLHDKSRDLNNDGMINRDDVSIVKNSVLLSAIPQNQVCKASISYGHGGFVGDVDNFTESLFNVRILNN